MPEFAEVETFRRQLEPLLINQKITSFESFHPRTTRRHLSPNEIRDAIVGSRVGEVKRHGKYIDIVFDSGIHLNIHLRMSGRILSYEKDSYDPRNNPPHAHVIFTTDKYIFLFVDPRTFGEMWLTSEALVHEGIDVLAPTAQRKKVLDAMSKSSRSIKAILLDQKYTSGIGNIYADEICAEAQLLPSRPMNSLTATELDRLNKAIDVVRTEAIEARGSSLKDKSFRDMHGELGHHQMKHRVHARAGKPCPNCGAQILKTRVAGRGTYFCPHCQH
jgi:formamidopyrimidine-DNA glycosylase